MENEERIPMEIESLKFGNIGIFDVESYVQDFNERVIGAHVEGVGDKFLPADTGVARSIVPPGTGLLRDFSYVSPDIPEFIPENCVGCMRCVTECPDTAILAKVIPEEELMEKLIQLGENQRSMVLRQFSVTKKFYEIPKKRGNPPGLFGIFIDPTKCKGCGECALVCEEQGYKALRMITKKENTVDIYRELFNFFRSLPSTPKYYIMEKLTADIMLFDDALLYVGGAGSCAGCGEATAIRMMLAISGYLVGRDRISIVAATGCNTVFGSTYPFNPYLVSWTNSLFENAASVAIGLRMRWNQLGYQDRKIWVLGGDGAMYDIGFQALSRLLVTGLDINVLVLDTQVYSNTGGQTSTASFMGQEAKMAAFGPKYPGKTEKRKEIAQILMMHPDVYVAQTTPYHINHFYKSVVGALEYEGPSVVITYSACQPEHGIPDNMAFLRAKMAVISRAFPLLIYDPRKGERIKDRLSLEGNPQVDKDWYTNPKTGEVIDFITFAREEGRFRKHFLKDGTPNKFLLKVKEERLKNWRLLQELAGII